MMKFTVDQQKAIDIGGSNVLVSAAAGSGKTAVLTQRIVEKLKANIDINELIVLTFTNASANDMKTKITNAVSFEANLTEQLNKISTANIMTFDAYALKLVKKYHYLLDLNSNIKIGEATVFNLEKRKIVSEIFKELKTDKQFIDFCNKYVLYDLEILITEIIKLSDNLSNLISLDDIVTSNPISYVEHFLNSVKTSQDNILNYVSKLELYATNSDSEKIVNTVTEKVNSLTNCDYETLCQNIVGIEKVNGSKSKKADNLEEINNLISLISDEVEALNEKCAYKTVQYLETQLVNNFNDCKFVADIVRKIDQKLSTYKKNNNIFEFNDIKKFSIRLLEENEQIKNEIKNNTNEILLDEYQDTDDIQEHFVSLISKNNVYMVGDIKQSIYAFRNANPQIFIDKYNKYIENSNGQLVTLNKNFRSNNEVITGINEIFKLLMDKQIGGIDYDENEMLVYGNTSYDKQVENCYNMELLNYELRTSAKVDAYAIAIDIRNKIENKFQVVSDGKLRNITYKDIVILTRKKGDYDTYKQIFEYLNIPLKIHGTEAFKSSYDIVVLKNLLKVIVSLHSQGDHRHHLMSVLNSYIFSYDSIMIENEIVNYDRDKSLVDNISIDKQLVDKLSYLNSIYNQSSIATFIKLVIAEFELIKHCNKLVDGEYIVERLLKVSQVAKQFDDSNMNLRDFINYLDELLDINFTSDIEYEINSEDDDVVQIMTIHKSKGLEFPVVYVPQLNSKFKFKNKIDNVFDYNDKYKILPTYIENNSRVRPFTKILAEEENKLKIISEEMRLFYVALTRAESKLILVGNFNNFKMLERRNCKSYLDFINYTFSELEKYVTNIDIEEQDVENSLKDVKKDLIVRNKEVTYTNYELDYNLTTMSRASKQVHTLFDESTINAIKYGNELHEFLEAVNFKQINYDLLTEKQTEIVNNLCKYEIITNNIHMYHEYEFYYDNVHGIIDLLIERDEEYVIVDFKTSNIDDEDYLTQLKTYQLYLSNVTTKPIRIALYSIIQDELKFY